MKCNRCGRDVNEDEDFCLFCGNNLKDNYKNKTKKEIEKINKEKEEIKEDDINEDEKDNTLIVALLILPICIIPFILFFISLQNKTHKGELFILELLNDAFSLFILGIVFLIPFFLLIIKAFINILSSKDNNTDKDNKKEP